jgi:gas vesicle protein
MIAFIVGALAGSVAGFVVAVASYRGRITGLRNSLDWWRDTAEQRADELKRADDAGAADAELIGNLRGEILQLAAEKSELNRLLDLNGIIR